MSQERNEITFAESGKPLRRFKVSVKAVGQAAPYAPKPPPSAIVRVEDRAPYERTISRHVEKTHTRGDGTKKTEFVLQDMPYVYDYGPEMRSDATRAYNISIIELNRALPPEGRHSADYSTKQLTIEDLGPADEGRPEPAQPRKSSRKEDALAVA